MAYMVYVQDSETGKVVRFGAYDAPPIIIAADGTSFVNIPNFQVSELMKPES